MDPGVMFVLAFHPRLLSQAISFVMACGPNNIKKYYSNRLRMTSSLPYYSDSVTVPVNGVQYFIRREFTKLRNAVTLIDYIHTPTAV